MAKKRKKQSKINQGIKKIFGGLGFDEGIERIDTDTLVALAMALKFSTSDLSRTSLLKNLRRSFSEADSEDREEILYLLESFVKSDLSLEQQDELRVEKLETILGSISCSADEAKELYEHFIQSSRKLTPEKVEKKLQSLRIIEKQKELSNSLNGYFSDNGRFEFSVFSEINIFVHSFEKEFHLVTRGFQPGEFAQKNILTQLDDEIRQTRKQHENRLKSLIEQLSQHPYLSKQIVIDALKNLSPDTELSYLELDNEVLKELFKPYCAQINIVDESFILYFQEYYRLFERVDIAFTTQAMLHRRSLLKEITLGREIESFFDRKKLRQQMIVRFEEQLSEITLQCKNATSIIEMQEKTIEDMLIAPINSQVSKQSLNLSPKRMRKIFSFFMREITPKIAQKQKELLLSRTIRDFKNMFGRARVMGRRLHFLMGPTNSGKTYHGMQKLIQADSGYYLAPLRLLALEGYETLKENGIDVSLITGEEQHENPFASHISSTIEMLNFNTAVEVAVIDEVQMLADEQRGWAWVNAIIGVSAKDIYMTGSEDALEAIKIIAKWLEEPLEIIKKERKNPLILLSKNTPFKSLQPSTAIIAFSRKQVLALKHKLQNKFSTSVIYGSLSPEVRREEAKRFRKGETQLLIATDAIAMGLNLPIKTILFSQSKKFDGQNTRLLRSAEVHQIAGRSGRFGLHEEGYVGAIHSDVLSDIEKLLAKQALQISPPFTVAATYDQVVLISTILQTKNLEQILDFFASNMHFEGPFKAHNIEQMRDIAKIVDRFNLDLKSKFYLSGAPVSLGIEYIEKVFLGYVRAIESSRVIVYELPRDLAHSADTEQELLEAEDKIKEITLYLWLSYRFSDLFIHADVALEARSIINGFIENSLQKRLLVHERGSFNRAYPKREGRKRGFRRNRR